MKTLEEAWRWYEAVRGNLALMERLARLYWVDLPWEGRLERDNSFRSLDELAVQEQSRIGREHLDDLAILVLFSVFEATVRHLVLAEVAVEAIHLRHPALRAAVEDMTRAIEEGSFFRVLEPFKLDGHADLVEHVNQVRRYRNWVAHGRRGDPPTNLDPAAAYERLNRFLQLITPPTAT